MNTFKSGLSRMGFGSGDGGAGNVGDFGPSTKDNAANRFSYGKPPKERGSRGIGGGEGGVVMRNPIKEDRLNQITGWIRNVSAFIFFLSLILAIALAIFQKKWVGAPSGLSGFLLFCNSAFFLICLVFAVVPIIVERTQGRRASGLDRAIREDRVGILGNAICVVLGIIVAMTQLISALTSKGCKTHSEDPHAKSSLGSDTDYSKALTTFCNIKKAEAVFLWLGWGCCVILAGFFFREFKNSRKAGPRIPPFTHPAGASSEGAFQPLHGDDEDDLQAGPYGKAEATQDDAYPSRYLPYQETSAYDAPGAYPSTTEYRNPLSDIAARYGMHSAAPAPASSTTHTTSSVQHNSTATANPFADALAQAQPMSYRMPPQYNPQVSQPQPPPTATQPYSYNAQPQQYQQQQYHQQATYSSYSAATGHDGNTRPSYDYGAYSGPQPDHYGGYHR